MDTYAIQTNSKSLKQWTDIVRRFMAWFAKPKREICCFETHWYSWIPKCLPHRITGKECEAGATITLSTCGEEWRKYFSIGLLTKFYNRFCLLFIIHWHTNFVEQIVFSKLYFKLINSPFSLCMYMLWPICRKQRTTSRTWSFIYVSGTGWLQG